MANKDQGVYLKPVVRSEMSQYVDGYGNSRDWKKYNKSLNVSKFESQPNPFMEMLTFRGLVKSEVPRDPKNSTGNASKRKKPGAKQYIRYLVTVRFHNLKFVDAETKQFSVKSKVAGREQWTRIPTIHNNKAMIKCQCRDFMMTWEKQLADNGGLWPNNRWTKYKKVSGSDRPPRNPKDKMGYCKHIQTFLQFLYDSGLIQNK